MPEVRALTCQDINIRVHLAAALDVIAYYTHPSESDLKDRWVEGRFNDMTSECMSMGLLLENGKGPVPTPLGSKLLETKDTSAFEENVRKCFETCCAMRFKYVWTAVCEEAADKNGRFTKRDVVDLFVKISQLSAYRYQRTTANAYAGAFLGWAKAAGVCTSESEYGEYRVRVRYEGLLYQLPPSQPKMKPLSQVVQRKQIGSDFELPILRLNSLIADIMVDEISNDDMRRIDELVVTLRGSGAIDEMAIDFLDDAIKTALSNKDQASKALVAKLLKKIRIRYLEKPQRRLSQFKDSQDGG